MLLHSGYHTIPRRKMLWECKPDCRNELVADAIRRDQMDAVLQCLHFRDNTKIDDDGYFKVNKCSVEWKLIESNPPTHTHFTETSKIFLFCRCGPFSTT